MHVAQRGDYLEFDDDLVLDQEVGGALANYYVVVKDDDAALLDDAWRALSHLVGQGVLVDLFNEPFTKRLGRSERTSNNPPG